MGVRGAGGRGQGAGLGQAGRLALKEALGHNGVSPTRLRFPG